MKITLEDLVFLIKNWTNNIIQIDDFTYKATFDDFNITYVKGLWITNINCDNIKEVDNLFNKHFEKENENPLISQKNQEIINLEKELEMKKREYNFLIK